MLADRRQILSSVGRTGDDRFITVDMRSLMLMIGLSLVIASLSHHLGATLAAFGWLNPMIWAIIISSLLGIAAAPTRLSRIAGDDEVSGIMLYVIVALIGSDPATRDRGG